nr:hypothetical protein Q903MT_gene630 [Picea sitchensis]
MHALCFIDQLSSLISLVVDKTNHSHSVVKINPINPNYWTRKGHGQAKEIDNGTIITHSSIKLYDKRSK